MKSDMQIIYTYNLELDHFLLLPTILACFLSMIALVVALIILLALSVNAFKHSFDRGLKRKFDDSQDKTPARDVNLVCSNTTFIRVSNDVSTVIPCLFIYDANDPLGNSLDNLLYLKHWAVRCPLGVPHRGYIKLFAQTSERSETGLFNFEGGSCLLKVSALSELKSRGLVYSSSVVLAPALPLYPVITSRGIIPDSEKTGVYLRSLTNEAPIEREASSNSD